VHAEIYDDGSIDADCRRASPGGSAPASTSISSTSFRARRDALLPAARFPVLRERWENIPTSASSRRHLGSAGWKLVIDSDLLFFRRPGIPPPLARPRPAAS